LLVLLGDGPGDWLLVDVVLGALVVGGAVVGVLVVGGGLVVGLVVVVLLVGVLVVGVLVVGLVVVGELLVGRGTETTLSETFVTLNPYELPALNRTLNELPGTVTITPAN